MSRDLTVLGGRDTDGTATRGTVFFARDVLQRVRGVLRAYEVLLRVRSSVFFGWLISGLAR